MPGPATTTSTAFRRGWATSVMLVVATLGVAACSGNDEPDDASVGSTAANTTTTATPAATAPGDTTTIASPEVPFGTAIADLNAKLAAAGDDFCAIAGSVTAAPSTGAPATAEDTKALYSFYQSLFDKIADNLPDSPKLQAGDADEIRAATDRMMAAASATGFDPAAVPSSRIPPTFEEPAVQPVMRRISEAVGAECPIGSEDE